MDLDKFISDFADQFEDTDPSEITADTVFTELEEWDSLTTLAIIGFVKTKYNKIISGAEIRKCDTVEELYNLVLSK